MFSSLAKEITVQNRTEVVTAVCEIFRNLGKERESLGQGCLARTKQSNECFVVTADTVIPNGQLDTCGVEFTRGDSKLKCFFLKDIKKNVYFKSGLVKIVIDLESVKKQHKKNTWSMFTKSPLTITTFEESKNQICYIGKKRFDLIVSRNDTIKLPGRTPPTIPNGLVILQTASNSTGNDVFAVGIQSQVDGNQKTIWMNEILGHRSLQGNQDPSASLATIALSMSEPPNPGIAGDTASNQTPTNGGDQQSLNATAAAHKPGNEPQNPVLNNGTAVVDNTDDSHSSPTHNEDSADSTVHAVGGADHNFQGPKAAYKPERDQHKAVLGHKMFSVGGNEEEVLQSEGNQVSLVAPVTAPDPSSTEPPNPRTTSTRTLANGDGQQSLGGAAAAAVDQPDNKPQIPVPNGGTAAGDADHYSQRTEGALLPNCINNGFPEQSPTDFPVQERSEHGVTGRASYEGGIVTENFEHCQGFNSHRRPSPTEGSFQSFQAPASTIPLRQIDNSVSQLVVTGGKGYRGKQRVELPEGYGGEGRRHSYPYNAPKKEEQDNMKRCFSEATMKERKIKLDDPLAKTILDRLGLLEGLSRCLDKEYKYGRYQCWKHIAEYFGIDEEMYQSFRDSEIVSPTEEMFEHLQTTDTEMTIGTLKEKLRSVERLDVIDVLVECQKTDCSVNDGTSVCSLFDSNPDIIGRIAFLLDRQKLGLKNWVQLAGKLDIPRKVSKSFETCNTDNPTEELFKYLKTRSPGMKVEDLNTHLEAMQRPDVVKVIKGSTEGKSVSFIKDLVKDVFLMEKLCELLNRKPGTNKVPWWKELGALLSIDTDILDELSPPQDHECPTEMLIRYLGSWRPGLKIADFIRALRKIERPDAIDVVKGYLSDGCDLEPLWSCSHERCHRNENENSQGP
ncbi:uncharacterized protein LOC114953099 isoform X2 [Acropora millepora]|uniref:uncharacterized protein LOC114953099 isoform X2 n=2 Tax=Acropora millepora TaxID=45264 RepID=UPI001CF457EE|nr:uncharacterized protein LOC114953099 isoform X2 [Acropora millepora]